MPAYYCTVAQAKIEINTEVDAAAQNAIILQDIAWASGRILNILQKRGVNPEPIVKIRKYDAQRSNTLLLNEALVELSSITLGDTQTPTASDYVLTPETAPYSMIDLFNGYSFGAYTNTPRQATQVSGVWAWHTAYSDAWLNVTTLNGTINDSVTDVVVTSAASLAVGQLIRVDSEYMRISTIVTNTLTVERGVNGSTAAAHDSGDAVALWRCDDLIVRATAKACALIFGRHGANEAVTYDGVTSIRYPADLPGEVTGILSEIPSYFIGMSLGR